MNSASKINEIVGKNILILRHINRKTQKDIAEILDVTYQQVQKYEHGKDAVSLEKLYLLQQRFGVPISFFLHGLPEQENNNILKKLSQEDYKLLTAITSIKNNKVKQKAHALIKTLAT